MYNIINDSEWLQEETKRMVKEMMKTRDMHSPLEEIGAENMLYWLIEESSELDKLIQLAKESTATSSETGDGET